jgi:hypothetical protein
MRLNLYWRGRDVIDVEVHLWRKREDDQPDNGPTLRAAGHLQDADRAEMVRPDTFVVGFGLRPESRGAQ